MDRKWFFNEVSEVFNDGGKRFDVTSLPVKDNGLQLDAILFGDPDQSGVIRSDFNQNIFKHLASGDDVLVDNVTDPLMLKLLDNLYGCLVYISFIEVNRPPNGLGCGMLNVKVESEEVHRRYDDIGNSVMGDVGLLLRNIWRGGQMLPQIFDMIRWCEEDLTLLLPFNNVNTFVECDGVIHNHQPLLNFSLYNHGQIIFHRFNKIWEKLYNRGGPFVVDREECDTLLRQAFDNCDTFLFKLEKVINEKALHTAVTALKEERFFYDC